jgi:hypothetical protein
MEEGWSDANHYVSGCGKDWFDLVLNPDPSEPGAAAAPAVEAPQLCPDPFSLTCHPVVGDLPVLDGDLSAWAAVAGIETSLCAPLTLEHHGPGKAQVKCAHSDDRIL